MKINMIAAVTALAMGVFPWTTAAQEQGTTVVPVELFACTFKEDKGWGDLKAVNKKFAKWSKKHDPSYSAWTMAPQFRANDGEFDMGWIGSWGSGRSMGQGMDNWREDDDDIGQAYGEIIECSHSLVSSMAVHAPNGPPQDDGVVWFSSCTLAQGSDANAAYAAHKAFAKVMTDKGGQGQSWLMYPALGFGKVDFDYYSVVSFENYAQLGEAWDHYTNGGGWMRYGEIMDGVASCDSPRVYSARQVVKGQE